MTQSTAADLAAAREAITAYFAAEALGAEPADLPHAEQRRDEVADGARLTRSEARLVVLQAQDLPIQLGPALLKNPTEAGHAEYRAALDVLEAVRRGLTADGYDVSTLADRQRVN
ncbi:hypothetical protein F4556_007606 [Kitasatospora gansuensis]|uniref:Uncharacterized protein n=1 Tax=Kitasatospora gansuensis TaxID=258050 RepID=A0A7W7SKU4_9ACTN|nr:hypothetical protein [Kitasatospora gansuensis]MBB4951952.1 hypothetical protein [Kitasatospora gansuensis]